jgi:hypothetical protein
MQARLRELKERFAGMWAEPDAFMLDAGTTAELLIAKVRLGLTLLLLAVPVINLSIADPQERITHLTGLGVTLIAVLMALVAYHVVQQGIGRSGSRWPPV